MYYHNFDYRYGYFVMKQPNGLMDYSDEGGPTDNCSPNMSVGRGPYRYKKLSCYIINKPSVFSFKALRPLLSLLYDNLISDQLKIS